MHKSLYEMVEIVPEKPAQNMKRPVRIRPRYMDYVFSSIDLGTSNCRMLMARPSPDGFEIINSFSRITRLGQNLSTTNRLSKEAMDRTIEALKKCAEKMSRRDIKDTRHIITEVGRRAENSDEFLDRVKKETGIELEIISSEEEARLALASCSPLLDHSVSHTLVFDIGGGSTEISWGRAKKKGRAILDGSVSMPFGVVTVSEAISGFGLTSEERNILDRKIRQRLEDFDKEHNITVQIAAGKVQMIGVSGTPTTLAAVHLGLPRYERDKIDGLSVSFDDMYAVCDKLKRMSHMELSTYPCIGPRRADMVSAGCAILESICNFWPVGTVKAADRGLREGALLDLMQEYIVQEEDGEE